MNATTLLRQTLQHARTRVALDAVRGAHALIIRSASPIQQRLGMVPVVWTQSRGDVSVSAPDIPGIPHKAVEKRS